MTAGIQPLVRLARTRELQQLVAELTGLYGQPPDVPEIVRRFRAHPRFDPERAHKLSDYKKHFSETDLDLRLEQLAEAHPEWEMNFEPFGPRTETPNYVFWCSHSGRTFALQKGAVDQNGYTKKQEYDKLITIKGPGWPFPVIFEVRISRWLTSKYRVRGDGRIDRGRGLRNSLRPEFYMRKLAPIAEAYGPRLGYVFVVSRTLYWNKERNRGRFENSTWEQFHQAHGFCVPFYAGRKRFARDVQGWVAEYKLPLKPG